MAKARRSLGRNSVSVLDTREEYAAEVTVSMSVPFSCSMYGNCDGIDASVISLEFTFFVDYQPEAY